MSPLASALEEYLAVRRALGFKLERDGLLLPDFVAFLERRRSAHITTELALEWARKPKDASSRWWASRLALVRGFARYMSARDRRTEMPPRELLSHPVSPKLEPYVYSIDDVRALLDATRSLHDFTASTYATLIGLLSVTGMRVGEAIGLDRSDLRWREGLVLVRSGKFGKSREVALHPTAVEALRAYDRQRDRHIPRPHSPAFFLSARRGRRLIYKNIHFRFHRLVDAAGLAGRRPHRPRIHDLRHTFAIRTVVSWYRTVADVESRLPALSTYLGHVSTAHTYWYLTATPELLGLARTRLERHVGARR